MQVCGEMGAAGIRIGNATQSAVHPTYQEPRCSNNLDTPAPAFWAPLAFCQYHVTFVSDSSLTHMRMPMTIYQCLIQATLRAGKRIVLCANRHWTGSSRKWNRAAGTTCWPTPTWSAWASLSGICCLLCIVSLV